MAPTPKPIDTGVEVGQVFLGKYRVDAILGHGGMGVVAQCHHLQLDERVAIKMLRPDVLSDEDAVSRFLREAQSAAKLKSEYVAKVSDVGAFENGVPYMVMEFLDGLDLGQMIEEQGTLGVPLVIDLMLQACEALTEAHALGIVHRDVKPTNLFVTWRADKPLLKVLDFGISKTRAGADMQLTQTQSLLGTPAYMSPEQMRSAREVDARSDIWSLGTVMYEAIEGHRPFEAESFSEMCVKVAVDPPSPMHRAPPALAQVLLRCFAKTPDQRYPTMADLARELIPFANDPHGAQMLVERMYRMMRRGQTGATDWTASSGTSENGLPSGIRDSQPNLSWPAQSSPQWAGGSTPAAQPYSPAQSMPMAAPAGQSMPLAARSQPSSVEQTYMVTQPRSSKRWLLIALIGLAAGLGGVAAIVATSSNEPTKPVAPDPKKDTPVVDVKKDVPVVDVKKDVPTDDKKDVPAVTDGKKDVPVVTDGKPDATDGKKDGTDGKKDDGKKDGNTGKPPHAQGSQQGTQIKKPNNGQNTSNGQNSNPQNGGTNTVKANPPGKGSADVTPPVDKKDPPKQSDKCADGSSPLDHAHGCPHN